MAILYQATFTTDSDGYSSDLQTTIIPKLKTYGYSEGSGYDDSVKQFYFNEGINTSVSYNNQTIDFYSGFDIEGQGLTLGFLTTGYNLNLMDNGTVSGGSGTPSKLPNATIRIQVEGSTQSGEGFLSKTGLEYLWAKLKAYFQAYIDEREPAIEVDGDWHYRIYNDGSFEAWYGKDKVSITVNNTSGTLYRSNLMNLVLPTSLTNRGTTEIIVYTIGAGHNNYPVWATVASKTATQINYYVLSGGSRNSSPNYMVNAYVYGLLTKV